MDIKCVHGESGWCDQCAQTSKQAKEASLASNMTTRQAFAMAAMQGMLSNPYFMEKIVNQYQANQDYIPKRIMKLSYVQADLMTEDES